MMLSYLEAGNRTQPPLILIHAFPVHQSMWKHQLEGLKEHVWVIAPGTPGFGGSALLDGEARMENYVAEILHFMDELGVEQAAFAGCSMGGYILFELWRRASHRVRALIFCDTRAEADSPEARDNRFKVADQVRNEGTGSLADGMPAKLLGTTTQQQNPQLVEEIAAMIREADPEAVARGQTAMARRSESVSTLPAISAPVLVIVGEEDAITPPDAARTIVSGVPNARLEMIEKAGHLSPFEQPEAVNRFIVTFLAAVFE
ncbi:MAG: alpha/beta fold hydrolase [bacterium]|nr:alpha/beta fold hydrolase [bacterium]